GVRFADAPRPEPCGRPDDVRRPDARLDDVFFAAVVWPVPEAARRLEACLVEACLLAARLAAALLPTEPARPVGAGAPPAGMAVRVRRRLEVPPPSRSCAPGRLRASASSRPTPRRADTRAEP